MQRPRFVRTLFLIAAFVIVMIGLHVLGFLHGIERPIVRIIHIGSERIYSVSVWQADAYHAREFTEDQLQDAFVSLQEKYKKAVVDHASRIILQEENAVLAKQLDFFSEKQWKYHTARVTGKHVDPFISTVTLSIQDAETLIHTGAPAVTEDGIFVGLVTSVLNDIVVVRLLDDGQTKVGAALLNDGRTIGVVEGGFGKSIRMNFIPQNENVSAGDIVVSSGLSEYVPYGLPIGTIEAVEKEPYQPFQSAVISPLVRPNRLRVLSLITAVAIDS